MNLEKYEHLCEANDLNLSEQVRDKYMDQAFASKRFTGHAFSRLYFTYAHACITISSYLTLIVAPGHQAPYLHRDVLPSSTKQCDYGIRTD